MTDDIKPEVIKKTQDTLGKFFKKPVLTEKLLTKPPFRFLHDICTAVMRETGFFEGVLTPADCKAENIKDRDGKIAFLQKVIATVEAATGIKLAVRPNKVVAGHEPTRTNEFLQALGKALEKQVKNGNIAKSNSETDTKAEPNNAEAKKSSKMTKKPGKEEHPVKKKGSVTKLPKSEKSSRRKIQEDSKNKASLEKKSPPSKEDPGRKNGVISPTDKDKSFEKLHNETEEKEKITNVGDQNKLKSSQAPSSDSSEISISKITKNKTEESEEIPKAESEPTETKRPISGRPGHRKPATVSENIDPVIPPQSSPIKENERLDSSKVDMLTSRSPTDALKRPESSFLKLKKQSSSSGIVPPHYSIKDTDAVPVSEDPSPVSRPVTSIRPTTGRPASARPAAPRIRDRGEISVQDVKQSTGNVFIITDNRDSNEAEEDENTVTVEPENDLIANELVRADQMDSTNDQNVNQGEHGLLVNQILETQKELDHSRLQLIDNKLSGKTEIEWNSSRNREATDREIKKLRLCIQTLTRSVNPLGKLLDFLQEDVDVMQKELITWKEMNSDLDLQIAEERSLTEQSIEPLKIHLKELQQNIEQQLEQMTVVKAVILRNDQKIQSLLTEMK